MSNYFLAHAKKKPIEVLTLESIIGVDFVPANQVISIEDPPVRQGGVFVDSVDGIIDNLKNKAKVIEKFKTSYFVTSPLLLSFLLVLRK